MAGRRNAGDGIVQECGYMVLQELPQILYDQLGSSSLPILLEALVYSDDIHQFVSEVVLAPLARLQGDGGAHGHRWHREDGQDHPFRPRSRRIHAHDLDILVRDLLKPVANV